MSKKRNSSKKKSNKNKNRSPIRKHIMVDYTFDVFPRTLNAVSSSPMEIIQQWLKDSMGPNPSLEDMKREMPIQQERWNSLSLEEKNNLLGNSNEELRENSINFVREHGSVLLWRRSYFDQPFTTAAPTVNEKKDYVDFFKRYISSLESWLKFLDENQNHIIDIIDNGATRNTLAAFVNMFTIAGLGIVGESFLNLIRTIWLRFGAVDDILWKYLRKIMDFAIDQEKITVEKFLENTKELFSVMDIYEELDFPSDYLYRYISHTPHYQVVGKMDDIKFDILRVFQEEYLSESDDFYLFSDFKSEADAVRINNLEKIEGIMMGRNNLNVDAITTNIHEDYGPFIAKRIKHVRNITLANKEQIRDVFLNGNEDELRAACDWFNANMDKSIISGIFLLRDIFEEKDREKIIDLSIKAVIAHNSDLLKLNGIELTNWLVLGIRNG